MTKAMTELWMPNRNRLGWLIALPLMLAALLAPAIWNGFPIVYYDTGGYLARPFEGTLLLGRSALYGVFLALGLALNFWPNILAQAALVIWLVALTLRVHGLGGRPWRATAIVLGLCVFTGLPWYAAQLMPDILGPAAMLAFALLALHAQDLRRWEGIALVALVTFAIASHMAILALIAGLVICLLLARWLGARFEFPHPRLTLPALSLALGVALAPLSNLAVAGQFAFTPGGANFMFARLVQDGIAQKYLAAHCPDATIRLCAYRDEIADYSADDWMWDAPSPLFKLGGVERFEPEARRIVGATLAEYPALHLKKAAAAAALQFVEVATGDGITPYNWHVQWIFERFAPNALPHYLASRQARAPFDFSRVNAVQVPFALAAIALMPLALLLRRRLAIAPAEGAFIALVLAALIGNAAICGVFSNPHDRYQSRLAFLAPFSLAIAWLSRRPPKSA